MTVGEAAKPTDPDPPPAPQGLLAQLLNSEADADYRAAFDARGSSGRPPGGRAGRDHALGPVRVLTVVAAFGLLLGVSAVKTERDRPQALVERMQLIAAIQSRQARLDGLQTTRRTIELQIAKSQTRLASLSAAETRLAHATSMLAVASGEAPVQGPGLVVTGDNAPTAVPGAGGVILDTDLQALVNGLWTAGAEAIAVNGHRLTVLTAIQYAGQAITVDYRSLTPPYVVEAIGNPDTLPARFLETQGGQLWLGLRSNFRIRFTTREEDRLELPGDDHGSPLWAHPAVRR